MEKRYNNLERNGIHTFSLFVTKELEWVIREQVTSDVGVDCQIECVDVDGNPNGILIGVQVKAGIGNVHEKNEFYTYYISKTHFYYWTKLTIPMIIIYYEPDSGNLYWEKLTKKTIKKTKKKYKIDIPKTNNLQSKKGKKEFRSLNTELSDINNLVKDIHAAEKIYKYSMSFNPNDTDALNQYGIILNENNYFYASMKLLNKAYKIDLKNNGISEKTIIRKLNFALNTLSLGKLKFTKDIVCSCEKEAKSILQKNHSLFAVIMNYYGLINKAEGNIDEAITNCKKGLYYAIASKSDYDIMSSLSNISEMYIEKALLKNHLKEDLLNALDYQIDALTLFSFKKNKFIDRLDVILSKIGVIYYYLKDFNRAIDYYNKSLKIQLEKYGKLNIKIANRYNNLSNAYASKKNFKKAKKYNQKAIDLNIMLYKTVNHYEIANLYFNKGIQELKLNKKKSAKKNIKKWENIMQILNLPIDRFLPTLNKAIKETNLDYTLIKTDNNLCS